jgi:hypothetical protein
VVSARLVYRRSGTVEREVESTYYACSYRVGRRLRLGHFPFSSDLSLQGFQLTGRFVTFVRVAAEKHNGIVRETVTQHELASGRRTFAVTYGEVPTLQTTNPSLDTAGPLVVANASGDAAWILIAGEHCPWAQPCPGEAVVVHDARGTATVATYPRERACTTSPCDPFVDIADLRIAPKKVLWRREGESFSAALT